jgi:phosphatidylserine decarboxylase
MMLSATRHFDSERRAMKIRHEVIPFLAIAGVIAAGVWLLVRGLAPDVPALAPATACLLLLVLDGYLFWFFRNPTRVPPADPDAILAGADGVVARITTFSPDRFNAIRMLAGLKPEDTARFQKQDVLRISIFLSLMNVHVNRVPIAGRSRFLGYFPGKHVFTFKEKSSDVNQHNSILIENARTCCLVNQIVGPVCRRVIYWLSPTQAVAVAAGDAFGMMKFGSRLDMYFPAAEIDIRVKEGDRVQAGVSVIGKVV